jgi:ribonucleoside-diphosphate reductase alpha chain
MRQAAATPAARGNTPIHDGSRSPFDDRDMRDTRSAYDDRTPPRNGIAPEPVPAPTPANTRPSGMARDLAARSGLTDNGQRSTDHGQRSDNSQRPSDNFPDRGLYAPAEAMRAMYDMGDAPSCATCGAIMTRSGSCYRCMSCGSTSGCS